MAGFVRNPEERKKALEITAVKSPVVKYLKDSGNTDVLDFIKVKPQLIKQRCSKRSFRGCPYRHRVSGSEAAVSEWGLLKTGGQLVPRASPGLPHRRAGACYWAPPLLSPNKGSAVGLLLLTLLAGLLIHGGANAINDYFDHKSGNDEANREFVRSQRRSRLIQLGLLTDRGTGIAMFCFIVSSAIGTTWRLPAPSSLSSA